MPVQSKPAAPSILQCLVGTDGYSLRSLAVLSGFFTSKDWAQLLLINRQYFDMWYDFTSVNHITFEGASALRFAKKKRQHLSREVRFMDLRGLKPSQFAFDQFMNRLEYVPDLCSLHLPEDQQKIRTAGGTAISDALFKVCYEMQGLTSLAVTGDSAFLDDADHLHALLCLQSLQRLDMSNNPNKLNDNVEAISYLHKLEYLNLANSKSVSPEALRKMLEQPTEANLRRFLLLLKSINLSGCQVTDDVLAALTQSRPGLRTVNFSRCTHSDLTADGFIRFLRLMAQSVAGTGHTGLVEVSLQGCPWVDRKVLVGLGTSCPGLKELNLSDSSQINQRDLNDLLCTLPGLRLIVGHPEWVDNYDPFQDYDQFMLSTSV